MLPRIQINLCTISEKKSPEAPSALNSRTSSNSTYLPTPSPITYAIERPSTLNNFTKSFNSTYLPTFSPITYTKELLNSSSIPTISPIIHPSKIPTTSPTDFFSDSTSTPIWTMHNIMHQVSLEKKTPTNISFLVFCSMTLIVYFCLPS